MRDRHHAPGGVWVTGGVGEGGGPRDHDRLPAPHRDPPDVPGVSQRHRQDHKESKFHGFIYVTVDPA